MSETNGSETTAAALDAMRARGLDAVESLLQHATPEAIIATCKWFDQQTGRGVHKGLLAKRIMQGGIDIVHAQPIVGSGRAQMFARFDRAMTSFPKGSVTESHRRMSRRCWRDEDCDCRGVMVVIDLAFPAMAVRCDGCGFEASYPFKSLPVLPAEPPIGPRPVPDPQPMVPPEQHRTQPVASTRELHPPRMDERSLRWRR